MSVMYTVVGAIALLYLLVLLAVPFLLVPLAVLRLTKPCVRVFRRSQSPGHEMEVGVSTVVDP